jgi:hypothetical protein
MQLYLEDNKHSSEGLKLVYALLFADQEIICEIDEPTNSFDNKNPTE